MATTPRSVFLMLMKESSGPHWGRLLKAAGKPPHFVKVDWSKYKDEEDEDSEMGAFPRAPAAPPARCRRQPTCYGRGGEQHRACAASLAALQPLQRARAATGR